LQTIRLIEYIREVIRDPKGEVWSDHEIDTAMWLQVEGVNDPSTFTAQQFGSTNRYRYATGDDHLWQVEVVSPTAGVEYVYDEGARTVFVASGTETRTEFEVYGVPIHIPRLRAEMLFSLSADPAKIGVYISTNNLRIDATRFADECRASALHLLGVR